MKLISDASVADSKGLEKEADEVIREFDDWFQRKDNSPLSRGEKAIIKTFLYFLAVEKS